MKADRTRGIFYLISKDFSVELMDTYYHNRKCKTIKNNKFSYG